MEGRAQPYPQAPSAGQSTGEKPWVWLVLKRGKDEYKLLEVNFEEEQLRIYSVKPVVIVDDSEVDEKTYIIANKTFKVSEPQEIKNINVLKNYKVVDGEVFYVGG